MCLYICIASALTISPLNGLASAIATSVFPMHVGPEMMIKDGFWGIVIESPNPDKPEQKNKNYHENTKVRKHEKLNVFLFRALRLYA